MLTIFITILIVLAAIFFIAAILLGVSVRKDEKEGMDSGPAFFTSVACVIVGLISIGLAAFLIFNT